MSEKNNNYENIEKMPEYFEWANPRERGMILNAKKSTSK